MSSEDVRRRLSRLSLARARTHRTFVEAAPELRADINVTPLVDVVLVLLIIFMVVTPMIASGISVDLPKTTNHSRKPDDGKDIIIALTSDERLYVGASRVERADDLARVVAAERRRFPEKSVFLKGDARAPFGAIKRVMQTLHEAAIDDIVLGTEERTQDEP